VNHVASEVLLESTTVALGDRVTVRTNSNAEIACTVSCGEAILAIQIHTSCVKQLHLGQSFGALEVSDFPEFSQCSPPPPPSPVQLLPCGCGDDTQGTITKPNRVEFRVSGGPALGLATKQSGKGGSVGDTIAVDTCGVHSVQVECHNKLHPDHVFLSPIVVPFSGTVVATTDANAETECTLTCGGLVQTVNVFTACSKSLFVGQSFGALQVSNFPDFSQCGVSQTGPRLAAALGVGVQSAAATSENSAITTVIAVAIVVIASMGAAMIAVDRRRAKSYAAAASTTPVEDMRLEWDNSGLA
jgi:hypothetical protein